MAWIDALPELPEFIVRQYPFRRRLWQLETGPDAGRRLHLIDHGDPEGRAVLMLHGNPTWSFLWRRVIAAMPGGKWRFVAPDLLGLGGSSRLPRIEDHSVDRHADAIAELVQVLELQNVILVGQDWGGPIITGVGARLPERIAGVVLGNTAVILPRHPRGAFFHRLARMPVISDILFRGLGLPERMLSRVQGDPASIRGDVARAYRWPLRTYRDRLAPLALARMVPDRADHPSYAAIQRGEAWLTAFEGPVSLVWGVRDPILGRALRRHRRALPRAEIVETEAGHFLQEEVPGELAAQIGRVAAG